ncbi:hypothetical protein KJ657_04320 [Patescibacteria group bacterium]|nr:hypothetical protein [Patescibacteria group bacterium]MBU1016289.1 hypothetical protein [Patescibacteria group bacterium]MBU1685565.1 hypothetical protein [Patescibacteria group bacterium]MBU1938490.1 hypothetical protein [Patescibacteria group bacterium]
MIDEVKNEATGEQEGVTEEAQTNAEQQKEEKPEKKKPETERQEMTTLHERTIAAMSYFGFLAIVPFYLKKDSEFCRFHGKQGLLLAIVFFMSKLFTVIDLLMDIVLILQIAIMFRMGFAALSGRWKKVAFIYDWSCQLEEALTLKTKEQELDEVALKPNEIKDEKKEEESKK